MPGRPGWPTVPLLQELTSQSRKRRNPGSTVLTLSLDGALREPLGDLDHRSTLATPNSPGPNQAMGNFVTVDNSTRRSHGRLYERVENMLTVTPMQAAREP